MLKGIELLHTSGCKIVVVTSAEFQDTSGQLSVIASNSKSVFYRKSDEEMERFFNLFSHLRMLKCNEFGVRNLILSHC